jgi:hypothetical protein
MTDVVETPAAPVAPVVAVAPTGVIAKVEAEVKAVVAKVEQEVKVIEADAKEAWDWIAKNAVAIKAKLEMIL